MYYMIRPDNAAAYNRCCNACRDFVSGHDYLIFTKGDDVGEYVPSDGGESRYFNKNFLIEVNLSKSEV